MKSGNDIQLFFIMLGRIIKMSVVSFWRNRWLSLATTLIIILTLIIISLFSFMALIVNKTATSLRERVDLVAYLKDSNSEEQIKALREIIESHPEVEGITYVSKKDALERWQSRYSSDENLKNAVTEDDNPLPRSLEIKTTEVEQISVVAEFLQNEDYSPLISQLSYEKNKTLIDRLVSITSFLKKVGSGLSLLFIIISIFVVYNAIKITIFARSQELEIMRLVGATDSYVRLPFVFEGVMYGLLAAVVSSLVLIIAYIFLNLPLSNYLNNIGYDVDAFVRTSVFQVVGLQFLIALLLGIFCSFWATREHLNK
jgi:cell division transport system permease protein